MGAGPTIKLSGCQVHVESSITAALGTCWLTGQLARHLRVQFRLELEALMSLAMKIDVFVQMPSHRCRKHIKGDFDSGLGALFEIKIVFSRTHAAFERGS